MDGIMVHKTNPFDFTIKVGIYVYIYYENLPSTFEEEPLKIPYLVKVLNSLVEVSIGGTFCWVRILEIHMVVLGTSHHISKGVNLHPHEVFYTK